MQKPPACHANQIGHNCTHYAIAEIDYGFPPLSIKTMTTLTALKKKIAALEAQFERAAKAELGGAIAKVRKIMADHGVTVEHLLDGAKHVRAVVSKKSAGKKAAAPSKGKKPAKYLDPKSGATWSGLGRIPAWIAKAKDRDAFLIGKPSASEAPVAKSSAKPSAKRAASKKVAKATGVVKTAAAKVASKKVVAKKSAPTKASASAKPAAAKNAGAKAVRKTAASKRASAQVSAPAADAATAK